MLRVQNISFRYKKSFPYVLSDFNFETEPGEIIGIKGESGKGKTTLAKIMAGYLKPQKGNIWVDNALLSTKGYCPVQLVFQHPEKAVNSRWKMKKILGEVESFFPKDEILHELSINPLWFDRYPHELSGGELQRIAVARILNRQTRFIIADEMTSMLDPVTQAQIWNSVLKFSSQNNVGVIAISHDDDLLTRICNKLVQIDQ